MLTKLGEHAGWQGNYTHCGYHSDSAAVQVRLSVFKMVTMASITMVTIDSITMVRIGSIKMIRMCLGGTSKKKTVFFGNFSQMADPPPLLGTP